MWSECPPHVAIGTSAIAVAASAAANLAGHARVQTVKWPCAITFAIAGMIGATAMPLINAIGSSLASVTAFGLTTAASYA